MQLCKQITFFRFITAEATTALTSPTSASAAAAAAASSVLSNGRPPLSFVYQRDQVMHSIRLYCGTHVDKEITK